LIEAMIFDLDGTLFQTEKLKAHSYARAVAELCLYEVESQEVIEAFEDVVGRSRKEVAESLVARFDLEQKASKRMKEFGVRTPWQAFIQIRLGHYQSLLEDPQVLKEHRWPHNLQVLDQSKSAGCSTALATMSHCE
jgi:phosphoglycolate phosphatase-like HAD superfamily hydrolase